MEASGLIAVNIQRSLPYVQRRKGPVDIDMEESQRFVGSVSGLALSGRPKQTTACSRYRLYVMGCVMGTDPRLKSTKNRGAH